MPATLSSDNGHAKFVVELRAHVENALDSGFESSITLCGRHWGSEHTFPFTTSIEGIWLRSPEIFFLRDHIIHWIRQPLDLLNADDLSAEFQLAHLPGQNISIRFGPRPDTISERHPVFSISFSVGAFQGEFHFVTDQSCLALFAEKLSLELKHFQLNPQ